MCSGTPDAGNGATGVVRHNEPGAPDSFTRRNIRAPEGSGSVGNLNRFPIRPDDPAGVSVPSKIGLVAAAAVLVAGFGLRFAAATLFAGPIGTVSAQQITGFDSHERSAVMVPVPPVSCCRCSRWTFHVGCLVATVVVVTPHGGWGQIGSASAELCRFGMTATARPMAAITATTVRPRAGGEAPALARLRGTGLGHRSHLLGRGATVWGRLGFTDRGRISRPCTGTGTR